MSSNKTNPNPMLSPTLVKGNAEEEFVLLKNGLPQRIHNWQVVKQLGKGASATVYLGKSLIDKNLVAIKQFSTNLFQNNQHSTAYRKMMMNEANLVGRLIHPNILQTYSVGFESEYKYLVMEYVQMGSLDEKINKPNELGLSEIIRIFFQCACALQYSDEIGIIHRDIKPANILLQSSFIPKITDFGSSMKKGDDINAISGVGSPAYMSPEQICEQPLNQQTDIYSLGISLYEMISGSKPFAATTQYETIYKILNKEIPPISDFIKNTLPSRLIKILKRSATKKQDRRYQNWSEIIFDLSLLLDEIYSQKQKYLKIDQISAFDWLRQCSSLKMFDDNELWDLIEIGEIYQVGFGTQLEIDFNEPDIEALADMNQWTFESSSEQPSAFSHSFILSGGIQVYNPDNKISVLISGDYLADLKPIITPKLNDQIDAYSIDNTVILMIEQQKINTIHPVVKNKLTTLINISAETQKAIKHKRHNLDQKVYTESDLIISDTQSAKSNSSSDRKS